jgi:beta propeller repeat protein
MIGSRSGILIAATVAVLLAPVTGGCSCGSTTTKVDASVDARSPELGTTDRGVDRGVLDRGPDQSNVVPCGPPRKLSPVLIPKKTPQACGPGCKQLTFSDNMPNNHYEVSGDILLHFDGIPSAGTGYRVFYVDLAKGTEQQLHANQPPEVGLAGCWVVGTDGEQIVYTCLEKSQDLSIWHRSITRYDPATQMEKDLFCLSRKVAEGACSPSFISPVSKGILIHWSLSTCGRSTALFLPTGGNSLTPLAGEGFQGQVGWTNGDGSKIVWAQDRTEWGGARIVVYDLDTGTQKRIDPQPGVKGDQWMPRIQGDKIVWVDHRNDPNGDRFKPRNTDIYHHDLSTGKTTAVTTHGALQERPDVYGDWVVWHDLRYNPTGFTGKVIAVFAKNIKTGQEFEVSDENRGSYPRIDRDRVFYRAWDKGNKLWALFMVDLKTFLAAQKNKP